MITRKQKMIQRIMTIIGIVIIIILSFLVILLRTDWLKSNEDIFYKYILKNISVKDVLESKELSAYLERNQKENYISTGNMAISKENKDEYLKDIKIATEEKATPETERKSFNIAGLYNDTSLFSLQYIRNGDTIGLKSNEVLEQYLTLKNDNLKEFIKKWGVEDTSDIPDKIELKNEKFDLSEEEKQEIKNRYMKIIKNNISKKRFKKQKKVEIEVDGKNIKASEYAITLSNTDLVKLEKSILETAKDDQSIIDIYTKMKDDINSEKQMKESIQNRIDYLNNMEIEDVENQNVTIKVYVNKGNLVKTIISQNVKEYSLSIIDDNSIEVTITQDIAKKEDKYKIKVDKKIQTDDILYKVKLENKKINMNVEFEFNVKGDINLNKIQEDYNLYVKNGEDNVKINYNIQKEFKKDVIVDEITNENSYCINDMTPEYIMSLFSDIGKVVGNLYNEKMQILGITETNIQE